MSLSSALVALALSGCVAQYAIENRHVPNPHKMPTPGWRVNVDMSMFGAGAIVAMTAPEGVHLIGFGAAIAVWAIDMIAVLATDTTE